MYSQSVLWHFLERGVTMEVYNNIPGMTLDRLLYNKKFRSKTPDSSQKLPGLVSPMNVANNYGLRLTTFYVVCYDIDQILWRFLHMKKFGIDRS